MLFQIVHFAMLLLSLAIHIATLLYWLYIFPRTTHLLKSSEKRPYHIAIMLHDKCHEIKDIFSLFRLCETEGIEILTLFKAKPADADMIMSNIDHDDVILYRNDKLISSDSLTKSNKLIVRIVDENMGKPSFRKLAENKTTLYTVNELEIILIESNSATNKRLSSG